MEAVNKLLDRAKELCSANNDAALAAELGVTRQALSRWRLGQAYPDEVGCARIADITGEPLARVLGVVGEARARSADAKKVWRRLAGTAASVALACSLGWAGAATPARAATVADQGAHVGYIMRNLRRLFRRRRPLPLPFTPAAACC